MGKLSKEKIEFVVNRLLHWSYIPTNKCIYETFNLWSNVGITENLTTNQVVTIKKHLLKELQKRNVFKEFSG